MKKLILIVTLLVSTVMFSSPSYSKWVKVTESKNGASYYVDFERIRKHDGYFYYWELIDLLKPTSEGYFSYKLYKKVDCSIFRVKVLDDYNFKESMAGGTGIRLEPSNEWYSAPPDSVIETIIEKVCSR